MALANMTQEQTNEENRNTCKRIAEELEQYVNGEIYLCPECGEHVTAEETETEEGEIIWKCSCGCTVEEEPEQLSIYDYTSDVLDIEFRCDIRKVYRSCEIMVTCGGPNIYIDTADAKVKLYWWGDRAEYPISYTAADALDDWAEEYFNY